MNTFTSTASKLGFVTSLSSSTWNTRGAYQGQYTGYSGSRVGGIVFSTLRNVVWLDQNISEIRLKLTYAAAGYNNAKNLGIYVGKKDTLSGTGASLLGSSGDRTVIGTTIPSNGNAYNGTRTITFNTTTNSTAFTNLKSFLQNGTTKTLVLYKDETISG